MPECSGYDVGPNVQGESDLRCPQDWQVIKVGQCLAGQRTVVVNDDQLPSFTNASSERVRLFFRSHYNATDMEIVGGIRTDLNTFQFDFNQENTASSGLFVGEILIYQDTAGYDLPSEADIEGVPNPTGTDEDGTSSWKPVYSHRVFVEIEGSFQATGGIRPLTIADIRLQLRDLCPEGNYLLDDYEYTDKEIFAAIHSIVDKWNETPPPVSYYKYTNFPFRYHWGIGTAALLMRGVALRKLRNWLPYSVGGTSVNTEQTWANYQQLSNQYMDEFNQFMRRKKIEQNIAGAYGKVSGGTARSGYRPR